MSDENEVSTSIGTLLLGLTGSIGVLSMPDYVRMFRQTFAQHVHVLMSRGAQKFITPYTFELFSEHRVFCDTFERDEEVKVPHIDLARRADLFVIAPATANVIAKCAHGLCVFVPSMNEDMWRSRVVQRNVGLLQELGHHVIEPTVGFEIADLKPTFGAIPSFPELTRKLQELLAR
jgi:phosphopantothenoylcysteine decarboxylase